MPIIKSAKKKMRQDVHRTAVNSLERRKTYEAVKTMRSHPTKESLQSAYVALDRAAKKNIIHKNKAARLKSHLAKLMLKKPTSTAMVNTKSRAKKTQKS